MDALGCLQQEVQATVHQVVGLREIEVREFQ